MNESMNPLLQLRQQDSRERWKLLSLTLIIGLTLSLVLYFGAQASATLRPWLQLLWCGGLGLTAVVTILLGIWRRRSGEEEARKWDQRWSTKNRLEAAHEAQGLSTPLAEAQRQETEQYLRGLAPAQAIQHRPVWPWALVAGLLLCAHLGLGIKQWMSEPAAVSRPISSAVPTAEIVWQSPESEVKATKIEEVPLVAELRSDSGVKELTLEIAVNGLVKKTVPLPPSPFQAAGKHEIKLSLYLDELTVEPFDLVSYHLHAQRLFTKSLPLTTSPLQFVQIRPFREEALLVPPGPGGGDCVNLLILIKTAQLAGLKQNFILTNTDLSKSDPAWQVENKRVSEDQATLATKTQELIEKATQLGWPAEAINLLLQAKTEMEKAAPMIVAQKNKEATPFQTKALNFIIEVEKFIVRVLAQSSGGGKPKPTDPFRDEQQFTLKPRAETDAGTLEKAAESQAKLLQELSTPTNPAKPALEQQREVSLLIGQLKNSGKFKSEVLDAVKAAHAAANESLAQLEAKDDAAAKEPAARTLTQLQAALALMKAASQREAATALAQAQRAFNEAASTMKKTGSSASERAQQAAPGVAQTRTELQEEAARQQESGDAKIAAELAKLAQEINVKKVLEELKKQADGAGDQSEKIATDLEQLARRAASEQLQLQSRSVALTQTLAELQRAKVNLERLATNSSGSAVERAALKKELQGDLRAAAQKACEGTQTGAGRGASTQVILRLDQTDEDGAAPPTQLMAAVSQPITELINILKAELEQARRQEVVTRPNPEEIAPTYRKPVADYFEELSKDYTPTAPREK